LTHIAIFCILGIAVTRLGFYLLPFFPCFRHTIAHTIAGIRPSYSRCANATLYVEDWEKFYTKITHCIVSKSIVIGDMGIHYRGITTRPITWPRSPNIGRISGAHPRNRPYVGIRLWPNSAAAFDSVWSVIESHRLSSFLNISIGRDCLSGDLNLNMDASGGNYSSIANASNHASRTSIWRVNIPLQDGTLGAYQLLPRKGSLLAHFLELAVHGFQLTRSYNVISSIGQSDYQSEYRDDCSRVIRVFDEIPQSHNLLQRIIWFLGGLCGIVGVVYGLGLLYLSFSDEGSGVMLLKGVGCLIGGWIGTVFCIFHAIAD
jgi:hypothetical protein